MKTTGESSLNEIQRRRSLPQPATSAAFASGQADDAARRRSSLPSPSNMSSVFADATARLHRDGGDAAPSPARRDPPEERSFASDGTSGAFGFVEGEDPAANADQTAQTPHRAAIDPPGDRASIIGAEVRTDPSSSDGESSFTPTNASRSTSADFGAMLDAHAPDVARMQGLVKSGVKARREIIGEVIMRLTSAGLSITSLSGTLTKGEPFPQTPLDRAGTVLSGVGAMKDLIKVANFARRSLQRPETLLQTASDQLDRRAERVQNAPVRSFAGVASGAVANVFTGLAGADHPIEISRNIKSAEAGAVRALRSVLALHEELTNDVASLRAIEATLDRRRNAAADAMERGVPDDGSSARITRLDAARQQAVAALGAKTDRFESVMELRSAFADLVLETKTAREDLSRDIRPTNVERNTRLAETSYDVVRSVQVVEQAVREAEALKTTSNGDGVARLAVGLTIAAILDIGLTQLRHRGKTDFSSLFTRGDAAAQVRPGNEREASSGLDVPPGSDDAIRPARRGDAGRGTQAEPSV